MRQLLHLKEVIKLRNGLKFSLKVLFETFLIGILFSVLSELVFLAFAKFLNIDIYLNTKSHGVAHGGHEQGQCHQGDHEDHSFAAGPSAGTQALVSKPYSLSPQVCLGRRGATMTIIRPVSHLMNGSTLAVEPIGKKYILYILTSKAMVIEGDATQFTEAGGVFAGQGGAIVIAEGVQANLTLKNTKIIQ